MQRKALEALLLGVFLAWSNPLRAGLYNPRELGHLYPVPTSFNQFQTKLSDLRGLVRQGADAKQSSEEKNDWIQKYQERFKELQALDKAGKLTVADRIELSACYLRIPSADGSLKPEEAIRALEPAQVEEPRNFMVLANLALANQMVGTLERAIGYERLALEAWPETHPGLSADQLRWYRRAERFYYQLLMHRNREIEQRTSVEEKSVDPLFESVDFARPDGEYSAGKISPRQWAELPGDAVALVEQLIFWLPFDNRLYWLLGEVLNARGDIRSASEVLGDLVDPNKRKEQSRVLRQHWRIVDEAAKAQGEASLEEPAKSVPVATSPTSDKSASNWLTDPRALGVGFAAGVLVTLLAGLQLREIRRRRESRAGAHQTGAG
jgi:tetratricopeptide (TPR) repeat protein